MIILIPLGGLGTRFKKLGYSLPKPLINVMGKPIIYWLLDNLNIKNDDIVLIPYNNEISKYNFEDRLKKDYPQINFLFHKLTQNTDGAAETILIALNTIIIEDSPVLCLDGDNFYTTDIIKQWNGSNCVFVFEDKSKEEVFSYVKTNTKNEIINIEEKNKISDLASTGGYGFNSWKTLKLYCQKIIDNNIKQKNEYYTSTVIKEMLKNNEIFFPNIINQKNYICLGTPLHVRLFCNNFPIINANTSNKMIESKRYCFDLDNTLVTFPKITGDYSSVLPIYKNIKIVKYLKKLGHTIIIYTARRMKTHKGNIGKLNKDIGKITFETLDKFDIPYDEIYFGKPYADFYIDDLAISAYTDLEKGLGFYNSFILPREFNQITSTSLETFKKSSSNLDGEIYYYKNIPLEIKDMFPLLISHDVENTWYEMEKINGIPISKLFLSEELTTELLDHIIGSINRIHNSTIIKDHNIYGNYLEKLVKRYNDNIEYYKKFKNSDIIYNELEDYFILYQTNNMGNKSNIHGDTVLTNILINQFGKIKFIDMRGKILVGNKNVLSLLGDSIYDYAKLYQSLIGYDEILENRFVNLSYKNKLIKHFEKKFTEKFGDINKLKMVTKLLLFTLIPLHKDNYDKCKKYYELINIF
jgi:capsule biosynthesis phosphatase